MSVEDCQPMDEYEPHPYTVEGELAGLGRFADGLTRMRQERPGSSTASRRQRRSRYGRALIILTVGLMLGGLISGLVFGLR